MELFLHCKNFYQKYTDKKSFTRNQLLIFLSKRYLCSRSIFSHNIYCSIPYWFCIEFKWSWIKNIYIYQSRCINILFINLFLYLMNVYCNWRSSYSKSTTQFPCKKEVTTLYNEIMGFNLDVLTTNRRPFGHKSTSSSRQLTCSEKVTNVFCYLLHVAYFRIFLFRIKKRI